MDEIKTIIIRLPNWLGDMVMSTAFIKAVQQEFPTASIDLIAKKELVPLLDNFPAHNDRYSFSKQDHKGLQGARKFGKEIRRKKKYDLLFCLPDSLSSAVMAKAVHAKRCVGIRKGANILLLAKTFKRKKNAHRAEEYVDLLSQYLKKQIRMPAVTLATNNIAKNGSIVININSEASSRRLPREKAVSIIETARQNISNEIILVGSPKEKKYVNEVYEVLRDKTNIKNIAGQTSLIQLLHIFAAAKGTLSTDSGPAHLSNAAGTNTIVLFGAGDESNTAPYNAENRIVMRLGKLPCEPCRNNVCELYGIPECLLQLDENLIAANVLKILA